MGSEGSHGLSFEETVLPHLDAAYELARWLVRDATKAEDVVQDAVLRALRHFAGFRGEGAKAWLLTIVRNTAYTSLKSAPRGREVPFDPADELGLPGFDPVDPDPGPEEALALRQDLARLDQAIAELPAELRECLVLRELEELSYKEIAEITGVPMGTVMSRLWRARQSLTKPEGRLG